VGIIFVYILLRIQPLGIPLDRDEGVFGLIGRTILEGGLPYQDGIDHKPPLVFYLYAVILSIFPPTALGVHLFLHLYNLLTLSITFLFTSRVAGRSTAYWVALLYAIYSINPLVQGFTASTEMFMLLPIMLCLLFALIASEDNKPQIKYLLLSGIFGALACWFKQPAVLSVLFALILIGYRLWRSQDSSKRLPMIAKATLVWLAGGVAISVLIVSYFALHGVLNEFLYWSFQHSFLYSSEQSITNKMTMAWYGLTRVITNSPIIFIFAISAVFFRHDKLLLSIWMFYGFFVLSLIGASLGFAYPHYFAQLIPSVVILAGMASNSIIQSISTIRLKYALSVTLIAVVVLAEIIPNTDYHLSSAQHKFSRQFFGVNPFPESRSIARYLNENTEPFDKILIYGSEPQILLMADRASATAFYVIYPLLRSEFPRYLEFQERAIKEIKATQPKYIVSVLLPTSLLYDGKAEMKIARFLSQYVSDNYKLENRLFYSEQLQSWVSYNHEYFQRGGKRSNESIVLHRRIDN
jgi:hypothetical protein